MAVKNIILKVNGSHLKGLDAESNSRESMEFFTEGRFMHRGDSDYLVYDETDMSGIEGCTTSLKVTGDKVRMKRYGEELGFENAIVFEKGKKWGGYFETPFGPIEVEVLTNKVENKLNPEGSGSVDIDCSICLKGLTETRNKLKFEIM